jgi:hypothetical protein
MPVVVVIVWIVVGVGVGWTLAFRLQFEYFFLAVS